MDLEDRVKASLRRRADMQVPDERQAWERISRRQGGAHRSSLSRAIVVAVALGISLATTALVIDAFSNEPQNGPVPAADKDLPKVVTITCAGRETSADTSHVAAQAEGVHVRLIGGPRPARLAFRGPEQSRYAALVRGDRGVVTPPPGTWRVVCTSPTRPRKSGGGVQVEVIDQDGLWVDGTIVCELSDPCNGIGTLQRGGAGDTIASIRRSVPGIEPGDVIERSGYPEAVELDGRIERYRVVRDGRIIGSVTISEAIPAQGVEGLNWSPTFWTARACRDTTFGQALLHA